MLSEGKVCLKEGSDGSDVFPVIIKQISLHRIYSEVYGLVSEFELDMHVLIASID